MFNVLHVETPNPLNPIGVRFNEMPLTPERIVAALREAGAYEHLS